MEKQTAAGLSGEQADSDWYDNTKDYVGRLLQDGSYSVNRPRRWSIGIQSKVFNESGCVLVTLKSIKSLRVQGGHALTLKVEEAKDLESNVFERYSSISTIFLHTFKYWQCQYLQQKKHVPSLIKCKEELYPAKHR